MKLERHTLSLAAEYSVAAELCRRGLYTQLTLGNLKRTDLLAMAEDGNVVRIEVKAKQGANWPGCKGIGNSHAAIVFVDYQAKETEESPDYYILDGSDWCRYLRSVKKRYEGRTNKRLTIRDDGAPIYEDERTKSTNKPYVVTTVSVDQIKKYKNAWDKIITIAEAV